MELTSNQCVGGVEMNKGEKEKCKGTKDEFCNVMAEIVADERHSLVMEYLNSHEISDKVENLLISLI